MENTYFKSDNKRCPEYYYLYNPFQADYFIKNGIMPIGSGKGSKGDTYIQFPKNTKSKEVMERWCSLGQELNN